MHDQRPEPHDIDIEPSTREDDGDGYADRELPAETAKRLRVLTGLNGVEQAPTTLGEFARQDVMGAFWADELGADALLLTDESRHEVRWGDRTGHTNCFLDALILAFLADTPVEITTRPPGAEDAIELVASDRGIVGGHEEMVVSFGFSEHLPADPAVFETAPREEVLAIVHEHGCPTQNLLPDEEAYQAWTSEADAATMPMSLPQAFAMVRDYVDDWNLDPDAVEDDVDIRPSDGDDYAERQLTDEITETLRLLTGLAGVERAPRTLGDFAQLHGHTDAFSPGELGIEATLLAEDSRHEVQLDDRSAHANCILDALILGFLEQDPVQVATRPPGSEEVIEFTVSERGIQGGNEDMVVSFGVSNQLPSDPAELEGSTHEDVLAIAHEHGCPKINLFPDEEAYQAWASEDDAVTMSMSLPQALALARDTVEALTG